MRRIFNFNSFTPVLPIAGKCIDVQAKNDVPQKLKQLVDVIYSVNPKLGYPQGDLAIWLSDNANPEIKEFIQKNLHMNSDVSSPIEMSTDLQNQLKRAITDDDIAAFSRRRDETSEEYSDRIYNYLQNMKISAAAKKETKRILSVLEEYKKQNAPSNVS